MSAGDDSKRSTTILAGILGTILLLEIVGFTLLLFCDTQRTEDQRKLRSPKPQELVDLQAEQLAAIDTYRMVNQQEGIVAIPIDRAIELYVAEVNASPPPTTTSVSGD